MMHRLPNRSGSMGALTLVRGQNALVKYVVQRFQINSNVNDPKPEAQQLVLANRVHLRPWLCID